MKKVVFSISLFLLPVVAFAQVEDLKGLADTVIKVINGTLVPLVFALAFIVFIWGIFRYFIAGGEEGKEQGKSLMIWGLVGFFVMASVWGLVNIFVGTFELDQSVDDDILPTAPATGGE